MDEQPHPTPVQQRTVPSPVPGSAAFRAEARLQPIFRGNDSLRATDASTRQPETIEISIRQSRSRATVSQLHTAFSMAWSRSKRWNQSIESKAREAAKNSLQSPSLKYKRCQLRAWLPAETNSRTAASCLGSEHDLFDKLGWVVSFVAHFEAVWLCFGCSTWTWF